MKGESPSARRDDGEETRAYQKLRVDQLKVAEEALRRYSVKGIKGERNGSGVAIVWFRNDLRILDNEALYRAWKSSETVLPVYCIDPRLFNGTTHYFGFPKTGELRAQFLLESLADLKENLLNRGLNLLIKFGKPEEVLLDIVQSVGAHTVYAHKETCSEEVLVERHVSKSLETITLSSGGSTSSNSHHPTLQLVWGSTMYHLLDLPFKPEYIPDVYTEFRKAVESKCKVRPCYKLPSSLGPFPKYGVDDLDGWGKVPTLDQLGLSAKDQSSLGVVHFIGGESAALARVHEYFWEKDLLPHYKETRNGMLGLDYSTKFSPWLAFGSLSPRYIHEEVKRYESERVANASTYWILFELIWRDYFRFISIKYGNSIFHLGGPRRIKEIQWSQDPTLFQLWRDGQTGYPLIDANMKELSATGFMSNRGRQIVCSFLVRDMGLDWRMGAEWFETCLLDYDPCSNYGNWTYGAGVGNDPREDRYFSIRKQAQSYDPDGKYVAHWLPDIAKLPREMRHFPGKAYITPVVPLKFANTGRSYGQAKGHPENNRLDSNRLLIGKSAHKNRRESRRPLTKSQLRKKLLGKNFPSDLVEAVITELQASGMQSDYAYAEMFSQSRWSSRGWGPKRIKAALVPKGISGAHIERALQHVFLDEEDDREEDDEDEEEMDKEKKWGMSKSAKAHLVSQATKQWLRSGNASLETRKARMVRWLQYRGFNWDVISPILRQLQSKYPAQ